jgi:hypothetical protein
LLSPNTVENLALPFLYWPFIDLFLMFEEVHEQFLCVENKNGI